MKYKKMLALLLAMLMCFSLVSCNKKAGEKEGYLVEDQLKIIEEVANKAGSMWELICRLFPDYVIFKDFKGNFTYEKIDTSLKQNTYDWSSLAGTWKGMDISSYQGKIDWDKVKASGIEYAIIRAGYRGYTEGVLKEDSKFEDNIKGALENDIAVGVYFVTKALTEEEGREEARYLIDMIKPYKITWPVVIDIEPTAKADDRTRDLSAEQRTNNVIAFCDEVRDAGYTPMIYGGVGTFMKYLEFDRLEDIEKWFAQYFREPFLRYEFGIWQATDEGFVEGIKGNVDIDYSIKNYGE